jgi:hypothetical protein
MPRARGNWGRVGKHLDLYERFESWREDEDAMRALAEAEGWDEELAEADAIPVARGSGAPEGRADFPMFLLSQIRYTLRQGFNRRAAQWQSYMGVEQAMDFRLHTVSALNGLTGMGPVDEYGEYPRARSSEEAGMPYSIGKHGATYGVTFEMVVNDQANIILNRTPSELGRMSAAYIAEACTALIESNPNWIDDHPFFTPEAREGLPDGNQVTGSEATPTEDNLVAILERMTDTVDPEGFPIDIQPQSILTRSEANRLIFKRVLRSQETSSQDTNMSPDHFPRGTLNPLNGDSLMPADAVIVEKYLKDATNWIVTADTSRPAWIIAFYLNQQQPYIGIEDNGMRNANGGGNSDPYTLDWDEIKFKIRQLFGVALGDPRSAHQAVNN